MKKLRVSRRGAILGVSAVLCLAVGAFAAAAKVARGTLSGPVTVTQHDATHAGIDMALTGNVSHLGKSRVTLHGEVELNNGVPTPLPPTTGTATAANGDTLSFVLQWNAVPVAPGVFDLTGPFQITAGSGRFAGATGNGQYRARLNLNTRVIVSDVSATIR